MPENTIEIASPSGLVFGFWFFLGITAVVGFSVTYLIWTAPHRFPAVRLPRLHRTIAIVLGGGLFVILFGWIYLSSLAGFHAVELREDGVTLRFVVPSTRVDLPWTEIGEVRREPSFRGHWRLVFYRPHGARLASANGSYREVKRAWIATARWLKGVDPDAIRTGNGVFRDD